ncbi:MAG: hypothetical protein AAF717_02560 [Bacteroidota bacterium]
MRKRWSNTTTPYRLIWVFHLPLLLLLAGLLLSQTTRPLAIKVELNSNSFNAKKRSSFIVNGIIEQPGRGLTLIHFLPEGTFEYKTFDTYGNKAEGTAVVALLQKMQKDNALFALLAHDSATSGTFGHASELKALGIVALPTLKGRQAYLMHNLNGEIYEALGDISTATTISLAKGPIAAKEYFPKITYEFTPSNDRYIAHAGGEIDGVASTNSLEALNENYRKGFRLFELDIITTSDNTFVAAHDWKMWARFTDYEGSLPPTHEAFLKRKIYGSYTTLDMEGINAWFESHPDARLITDKINTPLAFGSQFTDRKRLSMELFSVMAIEEAVNNDIKVIISQEVLMALKGDKMGFLEINNIKDVAVSRRIIRQQTEFLDQLRKEGIKVYAYNVNFDPGKDEKYVQENELGLIYGMYADKWIFDDYGGQPMQ